MVGFDEIILIGIVALLLFGPDKLPQYLKELGKFYAEIKKAQREFELELKKPMLESASPMVKKAPSPTVLEIAKKMNIPAEEKTEEQLLKEIDEAVGQKANTVTAPAEEPSKNLE
jgi:sec-independent protein translocase protein TatA